MIHATLPHGSRYCHVIFIFAVEPLPWFSTIDKVGPVSGQRPGWWLGDIIVLT